MRILVSEVGRSFGRQTRAYAEYRIFSSIARFDESARQVDVSLTATAAGGPAAACVITVMVDDGARLTVTTRGSHVHDAINRAAERIADALRRHSDPPSVAARSDRATGR